MGQSETSANSNIKLEIFSTLFQCQEMEMYSAVLFNIQNLNQTLGIF